MSSPLLNYIVSTPNPTEEGLRQRGFLLGMKTGWMKRVAQMRGVTHCELKSMRATGIATGSDWRFLDVNTPSSYQPPKGNEELWKLAKEIRVFTYAERNSILHAMGFPTYDKYLASPMWSAIRTRVFMEIGHNCDVCHGVATQVHHIDYTWQNLSGTLLAGMIPICGTCHTAIEMDGCKKRSLADAKNAYNKKHKAAKKWPKDSLLPKAKVQTMEQMMARIDDLEEAMAILLNRINGF